MPSALRRCEGMYSGLPIGKLAEGKTYTSESDRSGLGEKERVALALELPLRRLYIAFNDPDSNLTPDGVKPND